MRRLFLLLLLMCGGIGHAGAACTTSPDNTVIVGAGQSIGDNAGNCWSITAAGAVAINGTAWVGTKNVTQMAWEKSVIWQENSAGNWYSITCPTCLWTGPTTVSPIPPAPSVTCDPSPDNTVIKAGSGASIGDALKNCWAITPGGQVSVNGVTWTGTANVTQMAFEKGLIWQENSAGNWYFTTCTTCTWSDPTKVSPIPLPSTDDTGETLTCKSVGLGLFDCTYEPRP